jgi:hypothetical protein
MLCFGPSEGRQPTFVLLEEWIRRSSDLPREAALATLATRYFASHGPATLQDFAWWSGLLMSDARAGIEEAGAGLVAERHDGRSYWVAPGTPVAQWRRPAAALLPPWDEYLVAYRDREAALGHLPASYGTLGMIVGKSLLVVDGRVRGSWARTLAASTVEVTLESWTPMRGPERSPARKAVERYGRFLGGTGKIRIQ